MGRVGDNHVGLGHFRHHAALRQLLLHTPDLCLDLGLTFRGLVLVLDFLAGHLQILGVVPDLERYVDGGNHHQGQAEDQEGPAQDGPGMGQGLGHGLVGQAVEVGHVVHQQQGTHAADKQELGQRLDQFHKAAQGKDTLQSLEGIEFVELGRHRLDTEGPATQGHGRQEGRHQHQHHEGHHQGNALHDGNTEDVDHGPGVEYRFP